MSAPSAIITRCTVWPLMSMPRISPARSAASWADRAIFTPPALPRPPIFTCALTTTTPPSSPRSFSAASLADRKSTRLNSSHVAMSYAVFCLQKKNGMLVAGELEAREVTVLLVGLDTGHFQDDELVTML